MCLCNLYLLSKIRGYSLTGVSFHAVSGQYLSLEVPGLTEKRPSLMLGDTVLATRPDDRCRQVFEGCIHEVRSGSVLLQFATIFHQSYCGEIFDVEFRFNRGPFRRMHQAIEVAAKHLAEETLFPSRVQVKPPQVKLREEKKPGLAGERKKVVFLKNDGFSHGGFVCPVVLKSDAAEDGEYMEAPPPHGNRYLHHFDLDSKGGISKERAYKSRNGGLVRMARKRTRRLKWFTPNLNPEQRQAITRIVQGEARPLPYVIYGPPGTGKTVTVVESVLQIFVNLPHSRILVATPSNSSADLIAQRLVVAAAGAMNDSSGGLRGHLARLNAFQRREESVPEDIRDFCFASDTIDSLRNVVRHRIIVATCSTAGTLYKLDSHSSGLFTHCFVDESGHTHEPETLLPLSLVAVGNGRGQIVLAGDPKQLGPVLQSRTAKLYGLEESLLERLCSKCALYRRDPVAFKDHGGFDPLLVTRLVKNYRSHADIIRVPSRLFYNGCLEVCAPRERRKRYLRGKLPFLPNKKCPLVVHGLRGSNYQECDSPSWFNPVEALQVAKYLQMLDEAGVSPDDIGVITPYRKQVEKIRTLMDSLNLPRVKVGSVEEFQGQERPVILISTVRVSEECLVLDLAQGLGFLHSPKRMNVAITRAQSLLLVVGDPHVLCVDDNWRSLVEFAVHNRCYHGCDLPTSV